MDSIWIKIYWWILHVNWIYWAFKNFLKFKNRIIFVIFHKSHPKALHLLINPQKFYQHKKCFCKKRQNHLNRNPRSYPLSIGISREKATFSLIIKIVAAKLSKCLFVTHEKICSITNYFNMNEWNINSVLIYLNINVCKYYVCKFTFIWFIGIELILCVWMEMDK